MDKVRFFLDLPLIWDSIFSRLGLSFWATAEARNLLGHQPASSVTYAGLSAPAEFQVSR
jgi:hypothetical protein